MEESIKIIILICIYRILKSLGLQMMCGLRLIHHCLRVRCFMLLIIDLEYLYEEWSLELSLLDLYKKQESDEDHLSWLIVSETDHKWIF
jgi:hypothetical protein